MRLLLILFLCGLSLDRAQAQPLVIPSGWRPSLDYVRQKLEDQLAEGPAKQSMNSLTGQLTEVADAQLLMVYVQLHERLSTDQRMELRREQERWLKARHKYSDSGLSREERGSATPSEENSRFIEFTDRRARELRARLARWSRHRQDPKKTHPISR